MNNIFNMNLTLKRILCVLAIVAMWPLNLFAQNNDLGALEVGKTYTAPKFKLTTGYFVAPVSGELTVTFTKGHFNCDLFTSPDFEDGTEVESKFTGNWTDPSRMFQLTEGITYYLFIDERIQLEDSSFVLYMEGVVNKPLNVSFVNPDTRGNTMYDLTMNNEMYVRFSRIISEEYDAYMTYTSNGGEKLNIQLSPDYTYSNEDLLYIRAGAILEELLADPGEKGISPRAQFTIYIKVTDRAGQKPTQANSNGWLSYTYTCGYLPSRVISSRSPEYFLSYWPEGSEDAVISVTYSSDLRPGNPRVSLSMGNVEGDLGVDLYRATVTGRIEGNTVYADLSGVRRSMNDMMSSPGGYIEGMTVDIGGLYDVNGQSVVSNFPGGVANYVLVIPYKDLGMTNVTCEYTPAAGSSLAGASQLEVWISGVNVIEFDGFAIDYVTGGMEKHIVIPMSEISFEYENTALTEAVCLFSIPEDVKTADAVTIYPAGLISIDGYNYLANLTASFNTFAIIASNPTQGSYLDNLQDTTIEAIFNYTNEYPMMYVALSIEDEDGGVIMSATPMVKDNYGVYGLKVTEKLKLYQGHSYNAVFTAWADENAYAAGMDPIGESMVTWFGQTPPYRNSDVSLLGITPEEGSSIQDIDGRFTLSFSGLVRIDASKTTITADDLKISSTTVNAIGDNEWTDVDSGYLYSNAWEIVVPETILSSSPKEIILTFAAIDDMGKVLSGNAGRDEDSSFVYSFVDASLSGVETLGVETNCSGCVYTLSGIRVLENALPADLKTLKPGIYIVKGKKIIVK